MVIRVAFSEKKSQEEEGKNYFPEKAPNVFTTVSQDKLLCCGKKDPDLRGFFPVHAPCLSHISCGASPGQRQPGTQWSSLYL